MPTSQETSKHLIVRRLSNQLRNLSYPITNPDTMKAKVIYDRIMMILRQTLTSGALDTEEHRNLLEHESRHLYQMLQANLPLMEWSAIRHDKFYKIGADWKPELVESLPSFEDISIEHVFTSDGLGLIGGEHPHDDGITDDSDTTVRERRNLIVEWAVREYEQALMLIKGESNTARRHNASIFTGLIYNTLLQSTVDTNLSETNSKWRHVKANLVPAREFIAYAQDSSSSNAVNITNLSVFDLYSDRKVFTWNAYPTVRALMLGRSERDVEGTLTVFASHGFSPDFAEASAHYFVRGVLGMAQDAGVSDGTLKGINLIKDENVKVGFSPVFASTTKNYSVTSVLSTNGVTELNVEAIPTYLHTDIKLSSAILGDDFTDLDEGVTTVSTPISKTCIRMSTTSVDGTDKHTYTVIVVRIS